MRTTIKKETSGATAGVTSPAPRSAVLGYAAADDALCSFVPNSAPDYVAQASSGYSAGRSSSASYSAGDISAAAILDSGGGGGCA